jgi:hypothetical protein
MRLRTHRIGKKLAMSLRDRIRRGLSRTERPAADWFAAGSPLPDEDRRVEGLAFELGQVLHVQNWREPKPWAERRALLERVMTSPRWGEAGYHCAARDDECRITDAAGNLLLKLCHQPGSNGHVIERYANGRLLQRTRFDDHGRAIT